MFSIFLILTKKGKWALKQNRIQAIDYITITAKHTNPFHFLIYTNRKDFITLFHKRQLNKAQIYLF